MPYNMKFLLQPSGYSKNNVSLKEQQQKPHTKSNMQKSNNCFAKKGRHICFCFSFTIQEIFSIQFPKKNHTKLSINLQKRRIFIENFKCLSLCYYKT